MALLFQCPQCGRRFRAIERTAGQSMTCGCGARFEIPAATEDLGAAQGTGTVESPAETAPGAPSAPSQPSAPASEPKLSRSRIIAFCGALTLVLVGLVVVMLWANPFRNQLAGEAQDTALSRDPYPAGSFGGVPVRTSAPPDESGPVRATPPEFLDFELDKRIQDFAFSPDGRRLFAYRHEPNPREGEPSTEVAEWDMASGKKLHKIPWGTAGSAFSPEGRFCAQCYQRSVEVWNMNSRETYRKFRPLGITVFAHVDISCDGQWVVCPGLVAFSIINIESGHTFMTNHNEVQRVGDAKFFPNQPRLAVGRFESSPGPRWIEIYDMAENKVPNLALKVTTRVFPEDLVFSRDGSTLVVAERGDMTVFETKNWTVRAQFARKSPHTLTQYHRVVVSPDGAYVAAVPRYTGRPSLELWSVETQEMREFGPQWCYDAAFLADGTLAMSTYQNGLQFFDPKTGELRPPPRPAVAPTTPAKKEDDLAKLPPRERAPAYRARGRFAEAIAAYSPLLAAAEKEHGPSHPQTLDLVRALAECQRCAGNFPQAVELYRRSLTASEAALPPATVETPDDALELAHSLILSGNRGEAFEGLEKNLGQRIERFGADHPRVAAGEHALGWIYAELGDDLASNEHYAKGLRIRRRVLPSPHADLADSLMMSGYLQGRLDQFDRAVPLLEEATKMLERIFGESHPRVAEAQTRLGRVYARMSEGNKAATWFQRAWRALQKPGQAETPSTVHALRELSLHWARMGAANEAEVVVRRTLEMAKRVYGPKHLVIAQIYADMAENYLIGHSYYGCIDYQTDAIAAFRSIYGEAYPRRTEHLDRLAQAQLRLHHYPQTEEILREIRQIGTPPTAKGRDIETWTAVNYGQLNMLLKRPEESLAEFDRGVRGVHAKIVEVLPLLPDTHKARFAEAQTALMIFPYSAVRHYEKEAAWRERGAEWALNLKGLSDEVLSQQLLLQRDAPDETVRRLAQELGDVRNQIAALSIGGVDADAVGDRAEQVRQLFRREKELTSELGRRVPGLTAAASWKPLAEIRARLDPQTVLVEIVMAASYNPRGDRYGATSYLAFVVPPKGKGDVQLIDLGESRQVRVAVEKYRHQLADTASDLFDDETRAEAMRRMDKATGDLSAQLVHKLQPAIDGYDRWLLGLDGALWLVPWAALKGTDGKLLVETKEIGYVTSGRMLGTPPQKRKTAAPVIIADPDYDDGVPSGTGGTAFAALMASAAEADMVAPKIAKYTGAEPQIFTRGRASEQALKAQKSPRILFLSTHGYYEEYAWGKHPLLRSGLALAGANGSVLAGGAGTTSTGGASTGGTLTVPVIGATPAPVDDGILTGLEAVNLDLRGTELVVLSACHTGRGELRVGQGVTGLRQAFHLAGSESVIGTLWAIDDGETADLMGRFFKELSSGQRKTAALRRAQLTTIENLRTRGVPPHPHYWAAFILTGQGD